MKLEEKVKQYFELSQQLKDLKEKADALKDEIVKEMEKEDVSKVVAGDLTASLTPREYIKYTDELAILRFLKSEGQSNYVKETIDTTSFNKALKTSQSLKENLKDYYTTSVSSTLTVKEIKEC